MVFSVARIWWSQEYLKVTFRVHPLLTCFWIIYFCVSWNIYHVNMPTIEFSRNHKRKIKKTKSRLEIDFIILGKLFHKNYMILNPGKKRRFRG